MQDDDGRVLALDDGPQTPRIDLGPAVPPDGIPKSAIQIIPEETPAPVDDPLTLLAREEPHAHALADPLDSAMDVLFYGGRDGHGIQLTRDHATARVCPPCPLVAKPRGAEPAEMRGP